MRYAVIEESKLSSIMGTRLEPDKHTHCLVIGGSFPERFWSYSAGTLDEVTSERDKQDAGYIVEIDYLETEE